MFENGHHQNGNVPSHDNVVYLDPTRFGGPVQTSAVNQSAIQQHELPLHHVAMPAAMAIQMALQMYLAATPFAGSRTERATIVMLALARVTANLLHELGGHSPEHQARAMQNMADTVRIHLDLMQNAGNPS